jgi:nitrogen fixation NifU-like protein
MSSLIELYQEIIIEHSQFPRRSGRLPEPTASTSAKNPLCGDLVNIDVKIEDSIIKDISCESSGCAISTAAASIMAEEVVGKEISAAIETCKKFITSLKTGDENLSDTTELKVFCKVSEYPTRVKCASLSWQSLLKVLENLES